MQNIRKMGALLGAGVIMLGLAGCADKNNDGQADTPVSSANGAANAVADNLGDTANAAANGVGKVVNGAANGGKMVANAASNAGGTVMNGAANTGKMVAGAGTVVATTSAVKTALMGEKSLSGVMGAGGINVDSNAGSKTVTLSGKVKSAAQKTLAGAIAKKSATGMMVKNNLTVGK